MDLQGPPWRKGGRDEGALSMGVGVPAGARKQSDLRVILEEGAAGLGDLCM